MYNYYNLYRISSDVKERPRKPAQLIHLLTSSLLRSPSVLLNLSVMSSPLIRSALSCNLLAL